MNLPKAPFFTHEPASLEDLVKDTDGPRLKRQDYLRSPSWRQEEGQDGGRDRDSHAKRLKIPTAANEYFEKRVLERKTDFKQRSFKSFTSEISEFVHYLPWQHISLSTISGEKQREAGLLVTPLLPSPTPGERNLLSPLKVGGYQAFQYRCRGSPPGGISAECRRPFCGQGEERLFPHKKLTCFSVLVCGDIRYIDKLK